MSPLQLALGEARHEARLGLSSTTARVLFFLLAGYVLIVLSNADYLREMAAVDVPRNAPSLIYLMTSGQIFWLLFAWAWIFSAAMLRDREAGLQEIVLATPSSLRALLLGRYLGALVVAAALGGSTALGVAVVEPLSWAGVYAADSVAPTQWGKLLYSWALHVVPLAVGLGGAFTAAAIWARSSAGPYAVAAGVMLLWMFAMVAMGGGDVAPVLSGIIDPSGFAETERQVMSWTPAEKSSRLMEPTTALIANRVVWCLLPLLSLAVALARVTREHLLSAGGEARLASPAQAPRATAVAPPPLKAGPAAPEWTLGFRAELSWQLRRAVQGRGVKMGAGLLSVMCFGGGVVHVLQHAQGPILPRPFVIGPLLAEFLFLILAFVLLAITGAVARRDEVEGVDAMLDACPAPAWIRYAAKATAAGLLCMGLMLIPGSMGVLLAAIWAPAAPGLWNAALYPLAVLAPPMLEITAVVLLLHAALRSPGVAYSLSAAAVFVLVVNHEVGLASYPGLEVGIPAHVSLSSLTGWRPWAGPLLLIGAYKLCFGLLLVLLGQLLLPRGLEPIDARHLARLRGGLGPAMALTAVASVALLGLQLWQFVGVGGFETPAQALDRDALWERGPGSEAGAWSARGGQLDVALTPGGGLDGRWDIEGLTVGAPTWIGEVPDGFSLVSVTVNGQPVDAEAEEGALRVDARACAAPCELTLRWTIRQPGWDFEGAPMAHTAEGVWLDASRAAPRFGVDPQRFVLAPQERADRGLPEARLTVAHDAAAAIGGIAPKGRWSWSVTVRAPSGDVRHEGQTDGPLEALAWWSPALQESTRGSASAWSGEGYEDAAQAILEDLEQLHAALVARLPSARPVRVVVQAPRGWGEPRLSEGVLILPEDAGWDVGSEGAGRLLRRRALATWMAREAVHRGGPLRASPQALWLDLALPGALGALTVADLDGDAGLRVVLDSMAQDATQALAASPAPVGALGSAARRGWLEHYLPLAALHAVGGASPGTLEAWIAGGSAAPLPPALAEILAATPRASDMVGAGAGSREVWEDGGWREVGSTGEGWAPVAGLTLDAWPSYERTPQDNP